MKRRLLLFAAAFAVVAAAVLISLSISAGCGLEEKNTVFTGSFFDGVESACITIYGDPIDTIKGRKLKELCRSLSALELETTDEVPYMRDGELLYGPPWTLVLTYHSGDTVSFYFRDDLIAFALPSAKSDKLPEHLYKAAGGAQTVEDLIISHFELDEVS